MRVGSYAPADICRYILSSSCSNNNDTLHSYVVILRSLQYCAYHQRFCCSLHLHAVEILPLLITPLHALELTLFLPSSRFGDGCQVGFHPKRAWAFVASTRVLYLLHNRNTPSVMRVSAGRQDFEAVLRLASSCKPRFSIPPTSSVAVIFMQNIQFSASRN